MLQAAPMEVLVMRRQELYRLVLALGVIVSATRVAPGQDDASPLRLEGLEPVGARSTVTEAWGTIRFTVENRGPTPRDARVTVFYNARPDVQYGRDVWVPAHARVTSWLPIGPAPAHASQFMRDISYSLSDRTGGEVRAVPLARTDRLPSRAVPYKRREPTTAVYVDAVTGETDDPDPFASKDSAASQSVLMARTFRHARGLSESLALVLDRHLPPTPEAFDGIDQFVLAGNRLAADPTGRQALRHWVLHGGTLWVMLDRVDPTVLAPILGEGMRFEVVDRTTLTSLRLRGPADDPTQVQAQEFEQPVDLVRVLLSGTETVHFEANGWPAAFSQSLGRGRVVFTTLGGPGWSRPRTPRDPASPFENVRDLPVPLGPFVGLAGLIYPEPQPETFRSEDLTPLLTAEIGYEVVGRRTAAAILGGFVLAVLGLGIWLRRSRTPELIGLLGPAAAVAAAGIFVVTGAASRRAVPPTAASVAVVEVAPETGEAALRGLFAVYYPESGAVQFGSERGGEVELDATGLDGQTRRRIQTDLGAWHWENLAFPSGVRLGPFRSTARAEVAAVGRFGPAGLEGKLTTGMFRNPADAVILTRAGATVAVRLDADGSYRADSGDVLPTDQYLSGAVLTDRQQRRQDVYRRFLAKPWPAHFEGRDLFLVWADAGDVPFIAGGAERTVGIALLVVPLELTQPASGDAVTVPSGFVPYAAITEGRSHRPTLERTSPVRTRLRFQLPPSVHPLAVERATLSAKVRAPGRKFTLTGFTDGQPVVLHETLSPIGPVRVEITDPRFLRPDAAGGLTVELAVSERVGTDGRVAPTRTDDPEAKWQIESLGLEVVGRAGGA
jgi:hypothetical protein